MQESKDLKATEIEKMSEAIREPEGKAEMLKDTKASNPELVCNKSQYTSQK